MLWPVYRWTVRGLSPLIALYLKHRVTRGKEDRARLPERWGHADRIRPDGVLVWLHAASVGESLSLLPLVNRLLAVRADVSVLVTTGTMTSATMMRDRLPSQRAFHQFVPVDHAVAARRFLRHWRPDLAIWVESEFWPTLILETRRAGINMALVNARLSDRSLKGWQLVPGSMRHLLRCFDLILAQDPHQAARLSALGAKSVTSVGDLKSASVIVEPDPLALLALRRCVAGRPVWLAASTHPGEEALVAETHRALQRRLPGLVTIIAPRHPSRGDSIAQQLTNDDFKIVRRSDGALPEPDTDIWLIDTLGELGLFYHLAPLVLVAGSLGLSGPIGGHNPMEAAAIGCAILHGPDTKNSAASTALLDAAGAALPIDGVAALTRVAGALLADPVRLTAMGQAAKQVVESERLVVDAVMTQLSPLLPIDSAPAPRYARA